ncbi:host-nuclease inhibitor Gam family protein [Psychrobacillus sp. FSL H8-0487]|uniref:host-nuclease inhibitor Gam family protein n=1 Tax=Psychrobacillus sp. FSL H8-0487 TaxID=2921391 RepID=UPI0030F83DB5
MNKLQEVELEEMDSVESEFNKFEINDIDSLNWAFRKLSALKSKEKETKQLADKERIRITSWEQKELSAVRSSIDFFETMAAQYHMKQLAEDPKAKTISTPYGKVKSTTSKAQPDKEDEDKLLAFVKANNLPFVKTTEEIKWGDLKKTLQVVEKDGVQIVINVNGQAVPGATVKPQTTTFKVEIE